MDNVVIKDLVFDPEQIKNLYLDNEWYAYTNDLESLYNGILNSTEVLGAYINQTLVGLIRVVSDLHTVCHIQDILVLTTYQRQGIGSKLMKPILEKYQNCRQIILLTDNSPKTKEFYKSIGFEQYDISQVVGFQYKK